jgi:ubiquinone/menaquinone biosynthesis C-methylase UbiE
MIEKITEKFENENTSLSKISSPKYSSLTTSNEQITFIQNIKKWVMIDSQLKLINEKTKQLREMKNKLTETIIKYTLTTQKPDKIEITDGELKFFDKKEYSPLTFTYVEKCLEELIPNKEHVKYIMEHIKTNREVKISQDIKRIYK